MFKKTNKKGFTLIELIIVVAIMAVLVALLAPNVLKYLEKSKVGKDINSLDSVLSAIQAEITDDELCVLDTINGNDTQPSGIKLSSLLNNNSNAINTSLTGGYKALAERLFNDNGEAGARVLELSFAIAADDGGALQSKLAVNKKAEIVFFLDGNGGVAVAAIDSTTNTLLDYDGDEFFVSSNLSKGELNITVADGVSTVAIADPTTLDSTTTNP